MSEYQTNFNQNSSRRDDKISEMNMAIESQDNYIADLQKGDEAQQSCLTRMFTQKRNWFVYKVVMKHWKFYTATRRRKNRLEAYTRNRLHRNNFRRYFEGWRLVTHHLFKERIERQKH